MSQAVETMLRLPSDNEFEASYLKEAHDKMVKARIRLILRHPFFGQLALRLKLIPADPKQLPTCATDGRNIYYNPGFIMEKLGPNGGTEAIQETAFVVAHELGHCIFEHMVRRGGRDAKLWNIAGDYIINSMVDEELCQGNVKNACAKLLSNFKLYLDNERFNHKDWAADEVYDMLVEEQEGGGDPAAEGESFDVHIDVSGSGGKQDDENCITIGRGLTDEERKEFENDLRDAILQAARACGGAGDIPLGIKRMIDELLEPQIDWRDIIRAQIESSIRSNYSWLRPHRKGWHMRAILPGMITDMRIDVCLAIDTSGSISEDMLREFVSEVAGIMDQYEEYRIRIWQFDTKVYGYEEFNNENAKHITDYEIQGGGGTEFMVNWEFMRENEIMPHQFIMLTDGQPCGEWGEEHYCDTVFLINPRYGKPTAPFGLSIYLDEKYAEKH